MPHTATDTEPKQKKTRRRPKKNFLESHDDKPLFYLGRKQDIKDESVEDIAGMARDVWNVMKEANTAQARFFRRHTRPGYLCLDGDAALQEFSMQTLKSTLNELAYFYFATSISNEDGESETAYKARTAPNFILNQMLNNPLYVPPLPELERIVTAPYFTEHYTLHQSPGYNSTSKAYYHLTDQRLEAVKVSKQPTDEQVKEARNLILKDLLIDFPFSSEAERAHAVCLLLQPFVRSWFEVTPFFLIESSRAGTGKGLLGDSCLYPSLGEMPTRYTEQKNSEGWQKVITTILMTLPTVVFFDNVKRTVNDGNLESILTNPIWGDRILGSNNSIKLVNKATWLFAGNNVQIGEEISRRTIRIRMVANTANPNQRRKFKHTDQREWVMSHRIELVQAALTLVQHWIAKGKPIDADAPMIGSYESWCQTMHGILTQADIPGFLGNLDDMVSLDKTDWDDIGELIQSLWMIHKEETWLTADAFDTLQADMSIGLSLGHAEKQGERSQRNALGRLIMKNRDRVFLVEEERDRYLAKFEVKLIKYTTHNRAAVWKLIPLAEHWFAEVDTKEEQEFIFDAWAEEGVRRKKEGIALLPEEPVVTIRKKTQQRAQNSNEVF